MDEDHILYEMFLELMAKVNANVPGGCIQIISHPLHNTDTEETTTHKR